MAATLCASPKTWSHPPKSEIRGYLGQGCVRPCAPRNQHGRTHPCSKSGTRLYFEQRGVRPCALRKKNMVTPGRTHPCSKSDICPYVEQGWVRPCSPRTNRVAPGPAKWHTGGQEAKTFHVLRTSRDCWTVSFRAAHPCQAYDSERTRLLNGFFLLVSALLGFGEPCVFRVEGLLLT